MDMIEKMEELFLSLRNKLPYSLSFIEYKDYFLLKDTGNRLYRLVPLSTRDYRIFYSLYKSKYIQSPLFEFSYNNSYYVLYYEQINKSELLPLCTKIIDSTIALYNEFKYSIVLKRIHANPLMSLYKLLDNKFTYIEMRIREIEVNPIKNDIDWIILTKYYILLDAKIYLYDLQDDLFKLIDKKESVEYGLIYRDLYLDSLIDDKLYPSVNVYYGPIGMLYTRLYLEYNNIIDNKYFIDKINKLSSFDKKYFLFMTIYTCILNLNLDIILDSRNISSYILVTKQISKLIDNFKDYAK